MIEDLRAAFRGLSIGKEQQRLAVQAIVIGILVWVAIFALKESGLFSKQAHPSPKVGQTRLIPTFTGRPPTRSTSIFSISTLSKG